MTNDNKLDRPELIRRLFHVLEKQITQLETDMANPGDKEVAVLGTITRNLEKLIDIDQKESGRKPDRRRTRNLDNLRQKLTERIEQLQKD
jgi:hypothetical protein